MRGSEKQFEKRIRIDSNGFAIIFNGNQYAVSCAVNVRGQLTHGKGTLVQRFLFSTVYFFSR